MTGAELSHDPEQPEPGIAADLGKTFDDAWWKMQQELAQLSSKSTRTIAKIGFVNHCFIPGTSIPLAIFGHKMYSSTPGLVGFYASASCGVRPASFSYTRTTPWHSPPSSGNASSFANRTGSHRFRFPRRFLS